MQQNSQSAYSEAHNQRDHASKKQQQVAAWSQQAKQAEAVMSTRQAELEAMLLRQSSQGNSERPSNQRGVKSSTRSQHPTLNMTSQGVPVGGSTSSTRHKSSKRTQPATTKNAGNVIDFYGKQPPVKSTTNELAERYAEIMNNNNGARFYSNTHGFAPGMLKGLAAQVDDMEDSQENMKHQQQLGRDYNDLRQQHHEDEESSEVQLNYSHQSNKQKQESREDQGNNFYTRQRSRGERAQESDAVNAQRQKVLLKQQERQKKDNSGQNEEKSRKSSNTENSGNAGYHQRGHQPVPREGSQRKKGSQPPQPRNGSMDSSGGKANGQVKLEIQTDSSAANKFSQLVCQVPQGADKPQMSPEIKHHFKQQPKQSPQQSDTTSEKQMSYLLGPQRAAEAGRKCLVLDLDETLVHSSFKPVENPDITLKVDIEGQLCVIYVLVRPFVAQFLKRMSKLYELVVFTASLSKYAEPLVEQLDPDNFCSYKLFREHCTFYNNAFVKDLTRLGRPMNEVIILDNSPVAYLFQPENAMPAVSWYEDPTDEELLRVATILEHMAYEEDVRKVIRTLIVSNKIDPRQEQLYLSSKNQPNSSNTRPQRRDKSHRVDRRGGLNSNSIIQQSIISQVQNQLQREEELRQSNKAFQDVRKSSQANNSPSNQRQPPTPSAQIEASQQRENHHGQPSAGSHSRYDSSDGRQRHAAFVHEQIIRQKQPEIYPTPDRVDDLDIMLKQFKQNQQASTTPTNRQREANNEAELRKAHEKEQQRKQKQEAEVRQSQQLEDKKSSSSNRRHASRGRTRESKEPYSNSSNPSAQQQQEQIYEHHKQQIVQLRNEIAQLKSKQAIESGKLEEQVSQLVQKNSNTSQQPSARRQEQTAKEVNLKSGQQRQPSRRTRGSSQHKTQEVQEASIKQRPASKKGRDQTIQIVQNEDKSLGMQKQVKLSTVQQKMPEFLQNAGAQSTRHTQNYRGAPSKDQLNVQKDQHMHPTSTRNTTKHTSFSYFNQGSSSISNQQEVRSGKSQASKHLNLGQSTLISQAPSKGKSHTSHSTGRHQRTSEVTSSSIVVNPATEDLSQVVALAHKRERGHSAKPNSSQNQSRHTGQNRGGSSHHLHAKAHQNFAAEAGLGSQGSTSVNNNSLLLGAPQHQVRSGSANPYHSRGKKNLSTVSGSSAAHNPPSVMMPNSSKNASNTMIGNLSHMLNGVTSSVTGNGASGTRTQKNSGSYHYERLNKNHSTGRVSNSTATHATSAGLQHSSRHQYNASAGITQSSGNGFVSSGSAQYQGQTSKQSSKSSKQQPVRQSQNEPRISANEFALQDLATMNHHLQPSSVTHALANSHHMYTGQQMHSGNPTPTSGSHAMHQPNLQFVSSPSNHMNNPNIMLASQTPQATSLQLSTPSASAGAPMGSVMPSSSQHLLALNKHKKDLHEIMQNLTQQQNGVQNSISLSQSQGHINSTAAGKDKRQSQEYQASDYLKKLKKQQNGDSRQQVQDPQLHYGKNDEKHYEGSIQNQLGLLNHTQKIPSTQLSSNNDKSSTRMFNDIRNVMNFGSGHQASGTSKPARNSTGSSGTVKQQSQQRTTSSGHHQADPHGKTRYSDESKVVQSQYRKI